MDDAFCWRHSFLLFTPDAVPCCFQGGSWVGWSLPPLNPSVPRHCSDLNLPIMLWKHPKQRPNNSSCSQHGWFSGQCLSLAVLLGPSQAQPTTLTSLSSSLLHQEQDSWQTQAQSLLATKEETIKKVQTGPPSLEALLQQRTPRRLQVSQEQVPSLHSHPIRCSVWCNPQRLCPEHWSRQAIPKHESRHRSWPHFQARFRQIILTTLQENQGQS